jgi:anti-sigma28 factor (negative regulator of flagellin synthesis)
MWVCKMQTIANTSIDSTRESRLRINSIIFCIQVITNRKNSKNMSASSPFRSHLLQQWTKGAGRSPIGVATWLKKGIDEDTEEDNNSNPRSQTQSSNLYRSTQPLSSKDVSLSSMHASWSASVKRKKNEVKNHDVFSSTGLSSVAVATDNHDEEKNDIPLGSLKVDRNYITRKLYSDAINSMMTPRGGAAASNATDDDERRELLITVIDRAVRVAQIKCSSSQNGEVVVPFAFRRFFSNSHSSERLTEIGVRVNNKLAQTKNIDDEHSKAMNNNKVKEWSNNNVPAFIVALVHNNQRATNEEEEELNDNDPFGVMEYFPPETEQNLDDVSSCLPLSTITRSILLRD